MGLGAGASSIGLFFQDRSRIDVLKQSIHHHKVSVIALSVVQELFSRSAMALHHYVLLIASSAALVQTIVSGVQPLYVLVMGGIAWLVAPLIYEKPDLKGKTLQKLLAIAVMIAGISLLYDLI